MKYITRYIKFGLVFAFLFATMFITKPTFAEFKDSAKSLLPDNELELYSLSDIFYYKRDCASTTSYAVCGENAKEKYWAALSQYFDPIHTAAIMGNLAHEGVFSPTRWQTTMLNNSNKLKYPWATLYNCADGNCPGGVGAFQITYRLGQYLEYIDTKKTSLLAYFQDPASYSIIGDEALREIGDDDFDVLVQLEVEFVISILRDINGFKETSTLEEATDWWTKQFENCANCCGAADSDNSCESLESRRASAKKIYEEFKDFSCEGGASLVSLTDTESTKITFIGDSVGLAASNEITARFPSSFITMVSSRSFASGGDCGGDVGGIQILKNLLNNKGPIANQTPDGTCSMLEINPYTLQTDIVLELGTFTDGATKKNLENIAKITDEHNIFLVTPYDRNNLEATNKVAERYRDIASTNRNIYIIDWNEKVKSNPDVYISEDGVTPTELGVKIYTGLIADEISNSKSCAPFPDEFPDYQQCDPRWGKMPYGGGTFCSCSCGASSMAMLASATTGKEIFPPDIYNTVLECYAKGNCPIGGVRLYYNTGSGDLQRFLAMDSYIGQVYGFEAVAVGIESKEETAIKMREYLEQGYMLHFSGAGTAPFSKIGHYVGIFKLNDDGTVELANSCKFTGGYGFTLDQIVAGNKRNSKLHFVAIRANGKGNCGANVCEEDEKKKEEVEETTTSATIHPLANVDRLKKLFPNGIPKNQSEVAPYLTNIVAVAVDKNCNRKKTRSFRVHKDLAPIYLEIFEEMADMCFPVEKIGAQTWKGDDKGPSSHAYGAALDINPSANQHKCLSYDFRPKDSPYYITKEVANIWKKHGFTWGGEWKSCRDYMHFSYLGY